MIAVRTTRRLPGPLSLLWLIFAALPVNAMADTVIKAADGQPVQATLTHAATPGRAVALLFHQAHGNRHEYDAIVPELNRMGYDTLAVDQRAGGDLFDHANQTVKARGGSTAYLAAYPDLVGALAWARAQHYRTVVAVGSSYSASLTLLLAAQHGKALTAAAVFSPGEYFDDKNKVKNAVAEIHIPLYITTDPKEEGNVDTVLAKQAADEPITRYQPAQGVHGASTLVAARDPAGHAANWKSFAAFMNRFAPAGAQ